MPNYCNNYGSFSQKEGDKRTGDEIYAEIKKFVSCFPETCIYENSIDDIFISENQLIQPEILLNLIKVFGEEKIIKFISDHYRIDKITKKLKLIRKERIQSDAYYLYEDFRLVEHLSINDSLTFYNATAWDLSVNDIQLICSFVGIVANINSEEPGNDYYAITELDENGVFFHETYDKEAWYLEGNGEIEILLTDIKHEIESHVYDEDMKESEVPKTLESRMAFVKEKCSSFYKFLLDKHHSKLIEVIQDAFNELEFD